MDMQDGVIPEIVQKIQELENRQMAIYKEKMRSAFMAGVLFADIKNQGMELPSEKEAFEEWFENHHNPPNNVFVADASSPAVGAR